MSTSQNPSGQSSSLAPRPSPGVDTQDNRAFLQRSKLWVLGEMMATNLINTKPSDPIVATLALLEAKREEAEALGGASNHASNPAAFQVEDQPPSAEAVASAKLYMHEWRLAFLFEDWIKAVIENRPSVEATLDFTIDFFKKVRDGQHAKWKRLRELQLAVAAQHQNQNHSNSYNNNNSNNNNQRDHDQNGNNNTNPGTIIIVYDSNAAPSPQWTSFAARAASVGIVEMGFTAVLKSVTDVTVQDLVESQGVLLVLGEEDDISSSDAGVAGAGGNSVAGRSISSGGNEENNSSANANTTATVEESNNSNKQNPPSRSGSKSQQPQQRVIDDSLITKFSIVTQEQSSGAIIICGQDVTDERIEKLSTELFRQVCSVEKCAAVSNGSAIALGNGRVLLMTERDEGSAAACNLVGRKLVDDLTSHHNSVRRY